MSTAELCGSFRWMQAPAAATCCRLTHEQRGTTFYMHVQDPLLQPLSAAHAPQLGLTQQCSASPTGTLRGYIDQAPCEQPL